LDNGRNRDPKTKWFAVSCMPRMLLAAAGAERRTLGWFGFFFLIDKMSTLGPARPGPCLKKCPPSNNPPKPSQKYLIIDKPQNRLDSFIFSQISIKGRKGWKNFTSQSLCFNFSSILLLWVGW
jgi:hypothetical protein